MRLSGSEVELPPQLKKPWAWARRALAALGGGEATRWRYERADDPAEALLHVDGTQRGTCHHVGRCHAGQHVMVTIDLNNALAWQRCWDQSCRRALGNGLFIKARHPLGSVPVDHVPNVEELKAMEQQRGVARVTRC